MYKLAIALYTGDGRKKSLACVFFGAFATRVAIHVAAPVKLAAALPGFGVLMSVVTAATAHQVATVSSLKLRKYNHTNQSYTI